MALRMENTPESVVELEENFGALESALLLSHRRYTGRRIPFSVIRSAVESHIKRPFTEDCLRQLLFLLPSICQITNGAEGKEVYISHGLERMDETLMVERSKKFKESLLSYLQQERSQVKGHGKVDSKETVEDICKNVPFSNIPEPRGTEYSENSAPKRTNSLLYCVGAQDRPLSQEESSGRKRRRKTLAGLPESLLKKVHERQVLERQVTPEAMMARHRAQARASLPSFLDMVYIFFRTTRQNRMELEKLVTTLLDRCGPNAFPAVSTKSNQRQIIREQLDMLLELVPEFCKITESKLEPGRVILNVNIDDTMNLSELRAKTHMRCL